MQVWCGFSANTWFLTARLVEPLNCRDTWLAPAMGGQGTTRAPNPGVLHYESTSWFGRTFDLRASRERTSHAVCNRRHP
jgi:hypothetical protein